MSKVKRASLALLLIVCMMLSACGDSDADNSPSGTETSQSQASQSQEMVPSASPNASADAESSQSVDSASTPVADTTATSTPTASTDVTAFSLTSIPAFSNQAYVAVNDNEPYFSSADKARTDAFETYSSLDSLGRCGVAYANICKELMPTEARGEIGSVKPSGWQTAKYDFVDGKYLYNRCHLIGFQLAGENANDKNLITGTRYLNIEGMLPFENMVDDYVDETNNHVLYRVTPIFEGSNLVASGVLMEGWSVEDQGDGICFCVYAYNNQPGVEIDYATGDNWATGTTPTETATPSSTTSSAGQSTSTGTGSSSGTSSGTAATPAPTPQETTSSTTNSTEQAYVLNTNTKKFHYPSCSSVKSMSDANKQEYTGTRDDLIAQGYDPCGRCHP